MYTLILVNELYVDSCEWLKVSSETVVKAYIARIKEVDPILNVVVEDRFEEALRYARTCDKQIEGREVNAFTLASEKPLFGVPFTVKESCSLRGTYAVRVTVQYHNYCVFPHEKTT